MKVYASFARSTRRSPSCCGRCQRWLSAGLATRSQTTLRRCGAIFFCIDEFHEAQHHPKESEWLFPKVAAASQEAADAVRLLDQDHAKSEASARHLQHLLLAWEMIGSTRRETFELACHAYIEHLSEHMALEERLILPQAERSLSADDWQQLDDAFARGGDASGGNYLADPDYANLLERISRLVGPPSVH